VTGRIRSALRPLSSPPPCRRHPGISIATPAFPSSSPRRRGSIYRHYTWADIRKRASESARLTERGEKRTCRFWNGHLVVIAARCLKRHYSPMRIYPAFALSAFLSFVTTGCGRAPENYASSCSTPRGHWGREKDGIGHLRTVQPIYVASDGSTLWNKTVISDATLQRYMAIMSEMSQSPRRFLKSRLLRRAIALKLFGQLWMPLRYAKGRSRYAAKDGTGGNGQNWAVPSASYGLRLSSLQWLKMVPSRPSSPVRGGGWP